MSTMSPQVCLLTSEQIAEYWDRIEWRLDETPSMQRFYTKEDIIDQICKQEMQVWTAGMDLVLITQVLTVPIGKVLQIVWAHGEGLDAHFAELLDKFHTFAWTQECIKIEILGRPGWERKFREQIGFKVEYVAYSADVMKPRMH